MPVLIGAVLLVVLTYYLLTFAAQLALVLALPLVLAGLLFAVLRANLHRATRQAVNAKLADLMGLDTSTERLVFVARPDPELIVPPHLGERVAIRWVPWGCGALGLYAVHELHLKGGFISWVPWPPLVPGKAAFVVAVGVWVLWAVLMWVQRSKSSRHTFVHKTLDHNVRTLNSLAGKASEFHFEATRNAAFRAILKGTTDVPWRGLMNALQAHWDEVLDSHEAFRVFVHRQTEHLRNDNACLAELCPRYEKLQSQYSLACQEANWLGNEAVLHYLDTVGNGIKLLSDVVDRSAWAQLGPVIDGLVEEIRLVRDNIRQLGLTESVADTDGGRACQSSPASDDPYEVLGVQRDLSLAQIKEVYRRLAQIYHPDKGLVKNSATFQRHQKAWQDIEKQHVAA